MLVLFACSKSCGDCTSANIVGNDNGSTDKEVQEKTVLNCNKSVSSRGSPSKFCY
jgi:hypothetical protein